MSWQASILEPEVEDTEVEYVTFLQDMPGRLRGKTSWLGQAMLGLDHDRWRMGLSMGEMVMRYAPGSPDFWLAGTTRFRPVV